jgi:methanogenic corrinoid protein MtbC1
MTGEPLSALAEAVIQGDSKRAEELTTRYLNIYGMDPLTIIEEGLSRGVRIVKDRFDEGNFFLPDLVMGAEAMRAGIRILEPELMKNHLQFGIGRIVIGSASGDVRDIDKKVLIALLTASGFDVHDLGANVSIAQFIASAKKLKPDILVVSILSRKSLPDQKALIEALQQSGLRDQVKVLLTGTPVTATWGDMVGADISVDNVMTAVAKVKHVITQMRKQEGE